MGLWGSFKVDASGHGERTSLMMGEAEVKNEGPRKCLFFFPFCSKSDRQRGGLTPHSSSL